jgi:hypothetical protein
MAYIKRVSLLLGLAAIAALGGAFPAAANVTDAAADSLNLLAAEDMVGTDMVEPEESAVDEIEAEAAVEAEEETAVEADADELEAADEEAADTLEAETDDVTEAETSADLLLEPEAAAPLSITETLELAAVEVNVDMGGENLLAQATAPTFQGVSQTYLGVGGNLGIGDESPLGDFGFAVISKFSLGPRFSLRPAALIAEGGTSFVVPATYNFDTTTFAGFAMQPYVGVGVDIPTQGGVGLLLDAGLDIPLNPQFTLNATSLFRVTGGFSLGLVVGVGYNFANLFD